MQKKCEQTRSLVCNGVREAFGGKQGEWRMKLSAPTFGGKISSVLCSCLVFHSALTGEEVHCSHGQSRFDLPGYFVFPYPLVTSFDGAISNSAEPSLFKAQI